MFLFFSIPHDRVDGATLQQARDTLEAILSTDVINKALRAGRRLKGLLSIFSNLNTSPSVQTLINHLIPKVQAGLDLAEIVRKVKQSIGTGGGGGGTPTATIDVTPFVDIDGVNLRTDGQPQTAPWQLQWLFHNKLDKGDAITMAKVVEEINKQLGVAGADHSSLKTLEVAQRTLNNHVVAFKESLDDARSYLGGVDEFITEGAVSGKTVKSRLDELDAFTTNLNNFYNGLSATVNDMQKPELAKLEAAIGKSYLTSFNPGEDSTISARLASLESGGGGSTTTTTGDPSEITSGVIPGRNYWYKETLKTSISCNLSKLTTQRAALEDLNTTYWYPPLEAAEHNYVRETMGVWDGGMLRIFRGKCYIAILLTFGIRKDGNNSLYYRIRITNADLASEKEVVLASDRGELPQNSLTARTTINKVHMFHFRGNDSVPAAMVRFNWHNGYPVQDSVSANVSLMYMAPIYYNLTNGKAYMNPHPSPLQESNHPVIPADELVYFGVISNTPNNMMRMMRYKMNVVKFDVRFMVESGYVQAGKPWARLTSSTANRLSVLTNNAWTNNAVVKLSSQKIFTDSLQGCRLYSWWGPELSTQGIMAVPVLGAQDRLVRLFNRGALPGKGLFMLACELPEFMVYGLQGSNYSVDLSMVSLSGDSELTIEVIGVQQPPDILGVPSFPKSREYDLFVRDQTGAGQIFVGGQGGLTTLKVSANFDHVAPAKYVTVVKKSVTIPAVEHDPGATTATTITGKYKSLEDVVSFDLGTFPDRQDLQSLFIVVYPKYYAKEFDFACRANFTFRFGGNNGIMGEGMWAGYDTPQTWLGDTSMYEL